MNSKGLVDPLQAPTAEAKLASDQPVEASSPAPEQSPETEIAVEGTAGSKRKSALLAQMYYWFQSRH